MYPIYSICEFQFLLFVKKLSILFYLWIPIYSIYETVYPIYSIREFQFILFVKNLSSLFYLWKIFCFLVSILRHKYAWIRCNLTCWCTSQPNTVDPFYTLRVYEPMRYFKVLTSRIIYHIFISLRSSVNSICDYKLAC
jgi:hypothetical protein